MSLINDMLQDLDQQSLRQKHSQAQTGARGGGRSPKPWVFALAAFFLVALLLWWMASQRSTPAVDNELIATSDTSAVTAIPITEPPRSETTLATTEPQVDNIPLQNSEPALLVEDRPAQTKPLADKPLAKDAGTPLWLDDLLRAEQALAQDRLMLPAHDSAYLYYQRVLAVDPGNRAAEQGLARIAERYLALAESAVEQGQHSQAQTYLERVLQINPGHQQALLMLQAGPVVPAVATETKAQSVPEQNEPELTSSTGSSRVTPSIALREQRQVREAEALLSAGQSAEAITLLQTLIAASDAAQTPLGDARNLLLELYLQAGQVESAEALVEQSLPPVLQACLSARVLLHRGEPATALSVLERAAVGETRNEPCRTLLAGLYQRTGQYEAAESHYRRLLEDFGERGRFWLGLALALDEQQAYAAASAVYRRVLQSGDVAPELAAFAQQRLQQLGH
ncbi:MAG TPA: tetratricopeptide repeat protein [Cellvibrionaceae bacterium]